MSRPDPSWRGRGGFLWKRDPPRCRRSRGGWSPATGSLSHPARRTMQHDAANERRAHAGRNDATITHSYAPRGSFRAVRSTRRRDGGERAAVALGSDRAAWTVQPSSRSGRRGHAPRVRASARGRRDASDTLLSTMRTTALLALTTLLAGVSTAQTVIPTDHPPQPDERDRYPPRQPRATALVCGGTHHEDDQRAGQGAPVRSGRCDGRRPGPGARGAAGLVRRGIGRRGARGSRRDDDRHLRRHPPVHAGAAADGDVRGRGDVERGRAPSSSGSAAGRRGARRLRSCPSR